MAKDKKKSQKKNLAEQESETLEKIEDSAHQIWLAGLGAFYKAEKEGEKLFESLVKQGASVEEQYREYLLGSVKKVASTTSSTIELMEQMFEKRMAEAIARIPAPAAESMEAIIAQMNDLRRSMLGLMGIHTEAPATKQEPPKKRVVKKKVAKKTAAKKKVSKKPAVRKVAKKAGA